jgi:hypothetical protein
MRAMKIALAVNVIFLAAGLELLNIIFGNGDLPVAFQTRIIDTSTMLSINGERSRTIDYRAELI